MEWNKWSEEQRAAILRHSGNTLVSASAGSGKTAVVVEHVVRLVSGRLVGVDLPPVPVRRILMLTFNNAVGEELREKIHTELLKCMTSDNAEYVREQLYDLPFADIGTLHGYCKKLISEHFDALGLDPAFTVMDEEESERLFNGALTEVLDEAARAGDEAAYELLEFLGSKDILRVEISKLYGKACAEYDGLEKMGGKWLTEYSLPIDETTAVRVYKSRIRRLCADALKQMKDMFYLLKDRDLDRHADVLVSDARLMQELLKKKTFDEIAEFTVVFERAPIAKKAEKEADDIGLLPQFKQLRDSYKKSLAELVSLFEHGELEEAARMQSASELLHTLIRLTRAVADRYAEEKGRENKLDFDDLQQYACKLLEDKQLAHSVADKYDYVCVDEYQDINAVQEKLLQALTGEKRNLFMVGDAKQSIYAFRNADTTIFLGKYKKYSFEDGGTAVKLNRNFRSEGGILQFSNRVFSRIMTDESCGLDYAKEGMFVVDGADEGRVKVAVFRKTKEESLSFDFPDGYSVKADALRPRITPARKEGIYIADKINKLVGSEYIVDKSGKRRLIEYGDITLLARTTTGGVPQILETLRSLGIPLDGSGLIRQQGNIYIDKLVDYLRVIDNFRQDIPLASSLVTFGGFDFAECVEIRRRGDKKDNLWQAVRKCAEEESALGRRVQAFCEKTAAYRAASAYMSVSELIRRIISDADYDAIVRSCEGGGKFIAELNAFVGSLMGKQYDRSLAAFIAVTDSGIKTGVDVESENCVHTCTVHSSKGLEFPVVFLIDCGTERRRAEDFNVSFDRRLGISCKYADKLKRMRGDTLFFRFMREFKHSEHTAELIRLFYVALTRARNLLYVTGTCSWEFGQTRAPYSFLALLSNVFAMCPDMAEYLDDTAEIEEEDAGAGGGNMPLFAAAEHSVLGEYLDRPYRYAGSAATGIKYSVSAINKEQDYSESSSGASEVLFGEERAAIGTAYHRVLAQIDFSCASPEQVAEEVEKMAAAGKLSHAEAELIDAEIVFRCLNSDVVAAAGKFRHEREKRFTLYLPANEVLADAQTHESVLVQGAIDLMIFGGESGGENILVDFKYTSRPAAEVKAAYSKQLELYALAMEECAGIKPDKKILYILGRDEVITI